MSTIFTMTEQATGPLSVGHWLSPSGETHRIVLLKPVNRDEHVGVVTLLAPDRVMQTPAFSLLVWALSTRLLELGCPSHLA